MRLSRVLAFAALLATACSPSAGPITAGAPGGPAGKPALGGELDEAARARQVLDRLTFGARPGDLDAIERMGVDAWVEQQLTPERIPDRVADSVLALLETQRKQPYELIADHPEPNELVPRLQGRIMPDSTRVPPTARDSAEYETARKTDAQLSAEITPAKVIRAALSDRQLLEVMTDFWENHFSVSINKSPNRYAIVEYDRDVIRPHALGRFRDLLGAVAKSPMMLYYLDNFQSQVDSLHPTAPEGRIEALRRLDGPPLGDTLLTRLVNHRRAGINENYARELMELHTLGVDGGYTQHDVTEVARCFTGWTIDRPDLGGSFLFRQDWHDGGAKVVLGTPIPAGRGIEDGEEVLDMLARHPSTAHFIAKKLVTHFVSDSAPPALVERAAQTFLRTDGDIREVMRTIILSPEFNSRAAYRAKVKTPFELVMSTLRAMNAAPDTTQRYAQLVARLGQPIFAHLTPEGWPDQGAAWMNAGALLNRLNFGTQVGANQIPGMTIANWRPAQRLASEGPEEQVNGVIATLLDGDATSATRDALLAVQPPPPPIDRAHALRYLGELVGVAIGSPEFQHR